MIGFMPEFYPDELVYSLLARYYQRSGALAYRYAAEDLFADPSARVDIYFMPGMSVEARDVVTRGRPLDDLIENHTMFPCFCRFLPVERRLKAFQAMREMRGNYDTLVAMPTRRKGEERCLRYCPECVREDREQHGETYWHRGAQIHGMEVCPRHGCMLMDSAVVISSRTPPMLTPAEEVIPENEEAQPYSSEIQLRLAKYMEDVFAARLSLDNSTPVGDFLHSRMAWTQYRSVRGEQRNISQLAHDMEEYYRELPGNDFGKDWQLQKVLNNYRHGFKNVCMLAMFLDVAPAELADMTLPEKTQEQLFDARVRELRDAKLKYPAIAERLGAPYNLVKAIGEGRYGTYGQMFKSLIESDADGIPVHVILDDFACGCRVKDFDNYISVIRSRGIYTSLIIQSISQLQGLYGRRASTIVENCDTMLYLGGNDPETARVIGGRVNKPPHTILAMPVNESLIIRRGQSALTVRRNIQSCLDEPDEAERETHEAEIA